MSAEQWKVVEGFEGRFEVSTHGRVRSIARSVPSKRHGKWTTRTIKSRILATQTWSGYLTIALTDEDGKRTGKQVHRLVAEAFIPNPRSMNVEHAYKVGALLSGAQHHFARLPRDEAGRCQAEK